ncbi:MAG: hypothetical protein KGZ39_03360 [Simkania sp.]|nr:hypothetical protein [Simkania sp.]
MSKLINYICGAVISMPLAYLSADSEQFRLTSPAQPFASLESLQQPLLPAPQELPVEAKHVSAAPPVVEMAVNPFTGKIRAKKVRVRLNADLESRIIKELDKNDLVSVVGEKGDFYAVEAPMNMKAFIFRSFVLDNVVEGNHVNVRLYPDLESSVLGHLNSGDQVQGAICAENPKWLEIGVPPSVHFYVAKEFVENIGGPEVRIQMDKRKETVEQMLDNTAFLSKTELRKPFAEIDIERIQHTYKKVMNDYADLPEYVEQAHNALVGLQEDYLQKRIAFLEAKANQSDISNEATLIREEIVAFDASDAVNESKPTDKMLLWEPIEEALYLNWAAIHEDHNMQEYYEEQKQMATCISGILEAYAAPVKNKPGDFILKDKDMPLAYIYSTKLNLQEMVGKKVTLLGVERPNNNFAFPAYFVIAQE